MNKPRCEVCGSYNVRTRITDGVQICTVCGAKEYPDGKIMLVNGKEYKPETEKDGE